MAEEQFSTHADPVWRDRSNFIINAALPEAGRFEQLWARQRPDDLLEICCIPFFLYDVALGDVVRTTARGDRRYILSEVVSPSRWYVFRVWFGAASDPTSVVVDRLRSLGALMEWSSANLLSVDASDQQHAQEIATTWPARSLGANSFSRQAELAGADPRERHPPGGLGYPRLRWQRSHTRGGTQLRPEPQCPSPGPGVDAGPLVDAQAD